MVKINDTDIPYLEFTEAAAPGTPAAGIVRQYAKTDGLFYQKDDAGTETAMGPGAAGAPTNADYLVGTANGSLSAEIVVGTSPGGELGGTWASPTVDAVHSGTAHPTISNNIVATGEGLTGNNSWVNLATTGPAVTATVTATGIVKITLTARITQTAEDSYADMGFAGSGANTIAAGTANKFLRMVINAGKVADSVQSATFLLTGLAAGSTTFTAKYNQQGSAGTCTWYSREIIIEVW